MKKYDHRTIEIKWQKKWAAAKIYNVKKGSKKKYYVLIEFPYPSGAGLHVGHVRSYTALDAVARKRRMEGYNVLYPIGWDAFGLPTENFAVKTGIHPEKVTKQNTDTFRKQLQSLGLSFDWSREVNTTDPNYYRWTQWIFLQMFKNGLAYKAKTEINWCPSCKIGLANEEVVGGVCERCGSPTEKREKEQWMLAITKYADRLDSDLDDVDYPERVKIQQRNWIGKSEGSEISFKLSTGDDVGVFTTRADTLFGATYVVVAPEHPLIEKLKSSISNKPEVEKYIRDSKKKSEIERTAEGKEKTGVELRGIKAINPGNKEEIPIFVADYVLPHYGTGAIMAVPAHDERDFVFAKKYNLRIEQVIEPMFIGSQHPPRSGKKTTHRKTVNAILISKQTGKIGVLDWKGKLAGVRTFVMGGVEEGDTAESAIKKEIHEETGFSRLSFKGKLPYRVGAVYFAAHKDENRSSSTETFIFEVDERVQESVKEEEKQKHEFLWIEKEKVSQFISVENDLFEWKMFLGEMGAYSGAGILTNSGKFDGLTSKEAQKKITESVGGKMVTKYKLRDWVFSRQRYWGEPIPLIFCEKCNEWVPVSEKDLPVKLPNVKKYKPSDTGESPLAEMKNWVKTKCPKCGGPARRETDTMPQWAGSSWYYLRYTDPKNKKEFASKKAIQYWTPVDWYNGGMEHTTLHLLYSRFWHKFLYNQKLVPTKEPYKKRTSHGIIVAEGGEKMSKSKGNVINPDELITMFGADTLRLYEMFIGPFEQMVSWNSESIIGPRRFLERVWNMGQTLLKEKTRKPSREAQISLHKTIQKVGDDIEHLGFNTAISQLMVTLNDFEKHTIDRNGFLMYLQVLAPFAPHIVDELWSALGGRGSIHLSRWPQFNKKFVQDNTVTIGIQVQGKVRGEVTLSRTSPEEEARSRVLSVESILKYTAGKTIKKFIYVPGKIVNIIVE